MSLVEISHITRRFGSFTAVSDVSLTVGSGEVLGLLGANGAGKTTLVRMVCGLLKPSAGSITTDGRPGYMSQNFSLVEELTVHENIHFYGTLLGLSNSEIAAKEERIVSRLELRPYRDRQVRFLPSGWRQAMAFSVALLPDPSVLILDEPTSGLDALSRRRLWAMIHEEASAGKGIIVSTHYLDEAYYCNTLAIMRSGVVVAYGAPHEVASSGDELLKYFR